MTDPTPSDDELLSRHLDGATTAEESARIDTDPELQHRLGELRAARDLVAAPPAPLPAHDVDRLVAEAVSAAEDAPVAAAAGVVDLGAERSRRRDRYRTVAAIAAAVALIAIAVPLIGALDLAGDDDMDTAAVEADRDATDDESGGDDAATDPNALDLSSDASMEAAPTAAEAADDGAGDDNGSDEFESAPAALFSADTVGGLLVGVEPVTDPDDLADVLRSRLSAGEDGDADTLEDAETATPSLAPDNECWAELEGAASEGAILVAAGVVGVGGVVMHAAVFEQADATLVLVLAPLETCSPVRTRIL